MTIISWIIMLIWFLVSFTMSLITVNSNNANSGKRALTILFLIVPVLLIPVLIFITPQFKTKQNEK